MKQLDSDSSSVPDFNRYLSSMVENGQPPEDSPLREIGTDWSRGESGDSIHTQGEGPRVSINNSAIWLNMGQNGNDCPPAAQMNSPLELPNAGIQYTERLDINRRGVSGEVNGQLLAILRWKKVGNLYQAVIGSSEGGNLSAGDILNLSHFSPDVAETHIVDHMPLNGVPVRSALCREAGGKSEARFSYTVNGRPRFDLKNIPGLDAKPSDLIAFFAGRVGALTKKQPTD